ncbi:YncE family protein [Pseudomonas sp. CLCA07]
MTVEFSQPPVDISSDNTVLALFPPEVLGSTKPVVGAHCGAPIHVVDLPPMGAQVLVTAYLNQAPNDTVQLNLNGQPNIASAQTETESSDTRINLPKLHLKPDIVNRMTYTVIRNSQNQGSSEPPLEILYNDIRPGNQDTTPGPPHDHSRLELLLPDAIKNGVGPDFPVAGVQVCVRYPYCRAHDLIRLNCNGYDVLHTVTPSQAPAQGSDTPVTVCFTVTRSDLEAAKDHPQFVFSFTVTDQIGNGPDTDAPWSAAHIVDVDLAGQRLPAPILLENLADFPGDDSSLIEREKLGSKPLSVFVKTEDSRISIGDRIVAVYTAKLSGQSDIVVTVSGAVEGKLGQKMPCVLEVPNDKVLSGYSVTVMYEVFRGETPIGQSRVAHARVVGESTIELNPPTLVSAPNPFDPLNYPQGVSVRVDYAGAVPGDKARLYLVNPLPDSPAFIDLPLDQKFAVFILDAIFLGLWHGKVPQLVWKLIKGEQPVAESTPLVVTVNRIADGDSRLPTPTIDGATGDGVLDVAQMQDTAQLRVAAWLLQVSRHCIWLRYDGFDSAGLATELVVWAGAPHQSTSGLTTTAAIAWLKTLKDGSRLTLTFGVNFAMQTDTATMVRFPMQVYTVRSVQVGIPAFTNPPYVIDPAGQVKDIVMRLADDKGQPVVGGELTLTLPSGFTFADGGSGAREFTTASDGTVTVSGVKGHSTPGIYDLVVVSGERSVEVPVTVLGVVQQISVDPWLSGLVLNQDGSRAYACHNDRHNQVTIIDTLNQKVIKVIPTADNSIGIAISRDGTRLVTAEYTRSGISFYDPVNQTFIRTIVPTNSPGDIALSPDGKRAFFPVGVGTQPHVLIVDVERQAVLKTVPVGTSNQALSIALTPDGTRALVAPVNGGLAIFNTVSETVIKTLPVRSHWGRIAVSADGSRAVVCEDQFGIAVIDAVNWTVSGTVSIGGFFKDLAISPDGSRVYVTTGQTIVIVNIASLRVEKTIQVDGDTGAIALSPDGTRAYVSNKSRNTVMVVAIG